MSVSQSSGWQVHLNILEYYEKVDFIYFSKSIQKVKLIHSLPRDTFYSLMFDDYGLEPAYKNPKFFVSEKKNIT